MEQHQRQKILRFNVKPPRRQNNSRKNQNDNIKEIPTETNETTHQEDPFARHIVPTINQIVGPLPTKIKQEITNIIIKIEQRHCQLIKSIQTNNRRKIMRQYGFIADTTKTKRQNILRILTSKLANEFTNLPPKLAFHDLTTNEKIPKTTKNILGLGTKFCIINKKPIYNWIKDAQQRITRQI